MGSHGTTAYGETNCSCACFVRKDIFASAFVGPDVVHLSGDVQMQVMPVVGYKERSP